MQALDDNNLTMGKQILILGVSGGTGHMAVQIAKVKGARITAVTGSRKINFVKNLGAGGVIAYSGSEDVL